MRIEHEQTNELSNERSETKRMILDETRLSESMRIERSKRNETRLIETNENENRDETKRNESNETKRTSIDSNENEK